MIYTVYVVEVAAVQYVIWSPKKVPPRPAPPVKETDPKKLLICLLGQAAAAYDDGVMDTARPKYFEAREKAGRKNENNFLQPLDFLLLLYLVGNLHILNSLEDGKHVLEVSFVKVHIHCTGRRVY